MGGSYARTGLPPALSAATYDDANQMATWAGTSFGYDANGNLTWDGAKTYTWNARNELTALGGGGTVSFAYDGVGRRRSRTVGGTTTQFLYDGLNPVQELASGTPTANLLTGLGIDEYVTRIDAGGARHFLTDALGSTIALADGSGTVQTEDTYEPFGTVTPSGASSANTFGFTGRENDGTGLNYYRARYYDPRLQRFVAEDPIGLNGGLNPHSYVNNQPTVLRDPMGLKPSVGFGSGGGQGGGKSEGTGSGNGTGASSGAGAGGGGGPGGGGGGGEDNHGNRAPECFGSNFRFAFSSTNHYFFDGWWRLSRTAVGSVTAGSVARTLGTHTVGQALPTVIQHGLGGSPSDQDYPATASAELRSRWGKRWQGTVSLSPLRWKRASP